MLSNYEYFQILIDTVPQWFVAKDWADYDMVVNIKAETYHISSFRNATPQLHRWKDKCISLADEILELPSTGSKIIDKDLIQAKFVKQWLELNGFKGEWEKLFDYSRSLESRTYENSTIGFTHIYDPNKIGTIKIFEDDNQKILDVLGETQYTFFRIGKDWTFLDYNYVKWNEIEMSNDYKLVPEFLLPYQSILTDTECAITKTKRGDLIIYNKSGLLASCRKGEWKIYEARALKNTLVDYVNKNYWLGCNLFEILFDLSYRRHGALIVVDTRNKYKEVVNNHSSLIDNGSSIHKALSGRLQQINLSETDSTKVSKQLILELASVDGALILNQAGDVMGFGSIINTHPKTDGELGARSSAALSAYHYGLKVFKVSSDGEITLYHTNFGMNEDPELIKLNFL